MAGTRAHGTIAAGTRDLVGSSGLFLDLINSADGVGRYVVEVGLTPLNAAFQAPVPHTWGTKAGGTRSLAAIGGVSPLAEGRRILLSDGEYKTTPTDPTRPNLWCEVRITDQADIERRVQISQTASSRAQATIGEIELADADRYIWDILNNYTLAGQVADVHYVPVNGRWTDGRRIYRGIVDSLSRSSGLARISFRDISSIANVALSLHRYRGTGLAEGGADLEGTYRPLVLGYANNMAPLQEDRGQSIWRFNNGPHDGIDVVTDQGLPLIKVGNFTGSYAELRGYSSLNEGEWIDAPGLGVFKARFAGGSPGGEVRCSGRGDKNFAGYVDTLGDCALKVLDYCGVDRTLVDITSFSSLPSYRMGYVFPSGDTPPNGEGILREIMDPVLGVYGSLFDERFSVARLRPPDQLTYSQEFVENEIISVDEIRLGQPPIYRQQMLYGRNHAPLSEDQLGAGLTESQRNAAILRNPAPATVSFGQAKLQNRDAEEGVVFDTLIIAEADATAAAQMQVDFWKSSRRAFEVTLPRRGLVAQVGTTCRFTHFDLPGGSSTAIDATVVGRRDDYAEDQVRLTIIV